MLRAIDDVQEVSYKHDWGLSGQRSASGRMLFKCKKCGQLNPAPVKEEFENYPCVEQKGEEVTS